MKPPSPRRVGLRGRAQLRALLEDELAPASAGYFDKLSGASTRDRHDHHAEIRRAGPEFSSWPSSLTGNPYESLTVFGPTLWILP